MIQFSDLLSVAEVRQESHGKDSITLTVYSLPSGGYACAIQCRLGSLIKATYPTPQTETASTIVDAVRNAISTIAAWIDGNKILLRRLQAFQLIQIKQLEFEFC